MGKIQYRQEEFNCTAEREPSIEYRFSKVGSVALCDTITIDTCHYTYVQTQRMYNTKVDYAIWMIMMYQYWLLVNCNKRTTLVKDVDNGEALRVSEQEII